MSDEITPPATPRPAPWRGRPRVENPRNAWVHIRVTADERAALEAAAERLEMMLGPYVVSAALNAPQRRATRKPSVNVVVLSRLLGQLGKAGSNVNQLAKLANQTGQLSGIEAEAEEAIRAMRDAGKAISAALRMGKRLDDY